MSRLKLTYDVLVTLIDDRRQPLAQYLYHAGDKTRQKAEQSAIRAATEHFKGAWVEAVAMLRHSFDGMTCESPRLRLISIYTRH